MGTITHSGFRLTVIAPETDPRSYDFDEDRVSVGRAEDVTLGIEHAAISRHQFTIIRRTSSGNGKDKEVAFELEVEPRATNATQVRGRLLLPQRLSHGDVILVGPVEFRFEQKGQKSKDEGSSRKVRMAAGLLLLAILSMYVFFPKAPDAPRRRKTLELFRSQPAPSCSEPRICRQRAQEAYLLGQTHEKRGDTSPGDLYRAAAQYQRALGFLIAGGFAKESIPDLVMREERTRERYTAEVSDGLFRMRQAASRGDKQMQRQILESLITMLPDTEHPLRRELEVALAALPQSKRGK